MRSNDSASVKSERTDCDVSRDSSVFEPGGHRWLYDGFINQSVYTSYSFPTADSKQIPSNWGLTSDLTINIQSQVRFDLLSKELLVLWLLHCAQTPFSCWWIERGPASCIPSELSMHCSFLTAEAYCLDLCNCMWHCASKEADALCQRWLVQIIVTTFKKPQWWGYFSLVEFNHLPAQWNVLCGETWNPWTLKYCHYIFFYHILFAKVWESRLLVIGTVVNNQDVCYLLNPRCCKGESKDHLLSHCCGFTAPYEVVSFLSDF